MSPPPPHCSRSHGMLAVAGEVLVGLSLGFVLQLAFAAPIIAAEVIGGCDGYEHGDVRGRSQQRRTIARARPVFH